MLERFETRFCEIRRDGRRLSGVAMPYNREAEMPFGRERFDAGAFGDVAAADVILNMQHQRVAPLARTGGGGLVLTDGPDALRFAADLPATREADDTLTLVRAGVLRGASVEFRAVAERMDAGVRVIEKAVLGALAIVDKPAYDAATIEARRRGGGGRGGGRVRGAGRIRARIPFGKVLQCECHRGGGNCGRVRFDRKAFTEAEADEKLIAVAKDYAAPLASARKQTLRLRRTDDALEVVIDLPDTQPARDLVAAGGNVPLYARPLFDQDASDFTEAGDVADYSRVSVRAILIGATDRAEGWPELSIEGASPRRRRWRPWL